MIEVEAEWAGLAGFDGSLCEICGGTVALGGNFLRGSGLSFENLPVGTQELCLHLEASNVGRAIILEQTVQVKGAADWGRLHL